MELTRHRISRYHVRAKSLKPLLLAEVLAKMSKLPSVEGHSADAVMSRYSVCWGHFYGLHFRSSLPKYIP